MYVHMSAKYLQRTTFSAIDIFLKHFISLNNLDIEGQGITGLFVFVRKNNNNKDL